MRKLYLFLQPILAKLQSNSYISIDTLFSSNNSKIISLIGFSLIIIVVLFLILWIIFILFSLSYLELQGNNILGTPTSTTFNSLDFYSNKTYHCKPSWQTGEALKDGHGDGGPQGPGWYSRLEKSYEQYDKRLLDSSSDSNNPPIRLKTLPEVLKTWPGPTVYRGRAITADAIIRTDWNNTATKISKVKILYNQIASGAEYDLKTKQFKLIRKESVKIEEFELLSQKLNDLMAGMTRWAVHMSHRVSQQQEVDKDYYVHIGKMINPPQKYHELYVILDQLKDPNWFFRLDPKIEQYKW